MKNKVIVISSLLSTLMLSSSAFATFPTATFQWLGQVPFTDNTTTWQFRDPSGSAVLDGVLTVASDATFTSNVIKTILIDTTTGNNNALATDAKMKLINTTVIIGGKDYSQTTVADVTVKVNGKDMVLQKETDLKGFAGMANFEISSIKDLSTSGVKPGEGVLAAATIVVTDAS